MKKCLSVLSLLFIIGMAGAQVPVIKNFSFENWNNHNGFNYIDQWDCDSNAVTSSVVYRQLNGSNGSYSIHLGCHNAGGSVHGHYVEIYDTLSGPVGGLMFDLKIGNNNYQWYNGFICRIYFYDNNDSYINNSNYTTPASANYSTWTTKSFKFLSPPNACYYLLSVEYGNILGSTSEYCEVDNIRFMQQYAGTDDKSDENDISIFPNPAHNNFTVYNMNHTVDRVSVYSLTGECVLDQLVKNDNSQFDVTGLNSGVYMVVLTGKSGVISRKLIKE